MQNRFQHQSTSNAKIGTTLFYKRARLPIFKVAEITVNIVLFQSAKGIVPVLMFVKIRFQLFDFISPLFLFSDLLTVRMALKVFYNEDVAYQGKG